MDSPMSAFAMYKTNKSSNKAKKLKKKNKKESTSPKLPQPSLKNVELNQKEIALKLTKKQKKIKETKNIKKKQHKKKKAKVAKEVEKRGRNKIIIPVQEIPDDAENIEDAPEGIEVVPVLVPAQVPDQNLAEERSSSSEGFEFTPVVTNSVDNGLKVFKWMIAPFDPFEFLRTVWEKKPLHIARGKPDYYKEILTTPLIDEIMRKENIQYSKNIDVTSYVDGKRQTHNLEGRAHPHIVWDFYLDGCSIRLLNPQAFVPKLHLLNSTLQEFFRSFVGANAYLTPPDSQGFAPHYDDIEAFIIQTEGKKRWRIYKPLSQNETLPRVSSKNFTQDEIGQPIMEVTLEAGDMLYFPRGFIHQGVTVEGEHSLHVTISTYQKNAWADLFEQLIPAALQLAINENVELRRGLPIDIFDHFGLVHSDKESPRRSKLCNVIINLFNKIRNHLPIDEAVDQINKSFLQAALPPVLNDLERAVTVFGDTDLMTPRGRVINRVELGLDTRIRLLRKNILRLICEDKLKLYYYVENSVDYHGTELPFFEIEEDMAPAIETLINSYPDYVAVESLDLHEDSEKLQIAVTLWSRGLIMTETPLETIED